MRLISDVLTDTVANRLMVKVRGQVGAGFVRVRFGVRSGARAHEAV